MTQRKTQMGFCFQVEIVQYENMKLPFPTSPLPHKPSCPKCDRSIAMTTPIDMDKEYITTPGDLITCIDCLSTLQFQEDLSLKALSKKEFRALPMEAQNQVIAGLALIKLAKSGSPGGIIPDYFKNK